MRRGEKKGIKIGRGDQVDEGRGGREKVEGEGTRADGRKKKRKGKKDRKRRKRGR